MVARKGERLFVVATVGEARLLLRAFGFKSENWNEKGRYLAWESSSPEPTPFSLIVTGMGPLRAKEGLEAALETFDSVACVVGFGLAGGLAKSGKRGDLVIPTQVQWEGKGEMPTEWLRMSLAANATGEIWRNLITVSKVVSLRPEKAALFAATDAEAVDMESGVWGAVCRERRIPWSIVRAILDPANEALPSELSQSVDDYGRSSVAKSVPLFLRHPSLIGPALKLWGGDLSKAAEPATTLLRAWLEADR